MLDLFNFYVDLISGVHNFVAHTQVATYRFHKNVSDDGGLGFLGFPSHRDLRPQL